MLPELGKKKSTDIGHEARNSQPRFNIVENDLSDARKNVKSGSAKKVRTGGGFMKSNIIQDSLAKHTYAQQVLNPDNTNKFVKIKRNEDLSAEIKLIEKKIKACQRKLEQDRRRQKQLIQQSTREKDKPQYDFEKVVQRQLQMQGYQSSVQENNRNFDYLTNPKLNPNQEEEPQPIQQPPITVQTKPYDIEAGIEKLQKFYQNSLKKKFERREMFPHQACRRKTPKLYITQKTNALNKYGRVQNQSEHMFRVLTKQATPQQIYPTIPNFAVVKDSLSKNIIAYLGDYRPFLEKTKEGAQNNSLKITQQEKQENQNSQRQSDMTGSKKAIQINFKGTEDTRVNPKNKTRQSAVEGST